MRILLAIVVAMLALAQPARAQKIFEGTISYDISIGDKPMEIVLATRGKKVRQDVRVANAPEASRGNYVLFDFQTGNITSVFPAMSRYMVVNFKAAGAGGDAILDEAEKRLATIASTGRKETIAGVGCEVYVLKSVPDDEWCITTGLGHYLPFEPDVGLGSRGAGLIPGNPGMSGVTRAFKDGALILRMRMTDKSGGAVTMVATRIDRSPPSATHFAVPSGFEEVKNALSPR